MVWFSIILEGHYGVDGLLLFVQKVDESQYLRYKVDMKVGLIGFPGSGKTTVFNAITGQQVETGPGHRSGKPQIAVVKVPDARIDALVEIYHPRKTTRAEITFVDFASTPGAATRSLDANTIAGMRDVEALVHVIRGFPSIDGTPCDPLLELQDLDTELTLADLGPVEKRLERLKKEKPQPGEIELLTRLQAHLESGRPLRELGLSDAEQQRISGYRFLTQKPLLVILNVPESGLNAPLPSPVQSFLNSRTLACIVMAGPIEMEIAALAPEEQNAFAQDLGLSEPAAGRFIQAAYKSLDLISFLTAGEDECRAWTIKRGTTAHKAAGKIHSDIERGFIRAEVMHFADFIVLKSEAKAREAGKLRLEGKEYIVHDGDIMHFRHAT